MRDSVMWNERLVYHTSHLGEPFYEIHEVYYEDDGTIIMWDPEPAAALGSTVEELRQAQEQIMGAFNRPIIDEKDLPKEKTEDGEQPED